MAHGIDGLGIGGEQHRLGIHEIFPDGKLSRLFGLKGFETFA